MSLDDRVQQQNKFRIRLLEAEGEGQTEVGAAEQFVRQEVTHQEEGTTCVCIMFVNRKSWRVFVSFLELRAKVCKHLQCDPECDDPGGQVSKLAPLILGKVLRLISMHLPCSILSRSSRSSSM